MPLQTSTRRPDIDWLRICATYLLFLFHCAMAFSPAPFFHIRNGELSFVMLILCGFIGLWHMPLFFLLAGWSTHVSLAARGTTGYLRERVRKLLVPLVAACAILGPLLKFFELKSGLDLSHTGLRAASALQDSFRMVIPSGLSIAEPFHESFLQFLPTFFTDLDRFTWAHLWFLAYLLTFSVLYLPLVLWLGRRAPRLLAPSALWVYAPAAVLAVIQLTLRERWPGVPNLYDDWANFAYYSVYLLAGVTLGSQPELEDVLHREWKRALSIAVASTAILLLAVLGVFSSPPIVLAGSAVAGWCFVVAILGAGRTFLTHREAGLAYLRESAFPVYVLHQAAIVVPGYWILQLPLGIAAKLTLLLAVSIATTLLVYHFAVRRFAAVAVLLGAKPHRCSLPAPRPATAVIALTLVALPWAAPALALARPTPHGVWFAEGGAAKVEIRDCGATLCGAVVWLRSPWDEEGCEMRDRQNPDPALRDRTLVGLQIVSGFPRQPNADGTWRGGHIYDPGSGKTYQCQAKLDGPDRLEIRGYVGLPIFGRTTRWIREGSEPRLCRAAARASETDSRPNSQE